VALLGVVEEAHPRHAADGAGGGGEKDARLRGLGLGGWVGWLGSVSDWVDDSGIEAVLTPLS